MTRATLLAASAAAAALIATQVHAAGYYLQEQSVKGTGRAYSGEVADKAVLDAALEAGRPAHEALTANI